jgi:hypothetical protein
MKRLGWDWREERLDRIQSNRVRLDCDVEAEGVEGCLERETATQRQCGYRGGACGSHMMTRGWFQQSKMWRVAPSMAIVKMARDRVG